MARASDYPRFGRAAWLILAAALGFAVIACVLPDNPYQRWQLLDSTIHARARWIYERVNFDPAPIDVAVVGPSRFGAGISAPLLSRLLAERGAPSHVVNFSLPENGRDINAAIVRMMLTRKRPKLIIIGVIEKPSRFGHSAFKYIAPADMIANPGYFGNVNYPANLAYLPYRQIELFAANLLPRAMGLSKDFDPARYRGSTVDTTGDIKLPDGKTKLCTLPGAREELMRGVRKLTQGMTPPALGADLADVEFGDDRHFITEIARQARARGIKVAFLALPFYTGPGSVQEARFYERYGPLWNAAFLSSHAEWYCDYAHMDSAGATVLTTRLAAAVAPMLEPAR